VQGLWLSAQAPSRELITRASSPGLGKSPISQGLRPTTAEPHLSRPNVLCANVIVVQCLGREAKPNLLRQQAVHAQANGIMCFCAICLTAKDGYFKKNINEQFAALPMTRVRFTA